MRLRAVENLCLHSTRCMLASYIVHSMCLLGMSRALQFSR